MTSQGEDCTFGDIPRHVFKQGSFGITTPQTSPPALASLVQALPPSPSPSQCSPGPSTVLSPSYQPWPSTAASEARSVSPLTPRSLQERRAELALKVDGVLRDTSDTQTKLAAQDARLGVMQQGLKPDSATPPNSQKMDQLRQHITDLRTIVTQDGSRVPGALQHVQRMLRLLAGQANAVDADADGREVINSIDVLSREVSQLIELAARGERTAGEVMTIRRTLEDLQQDVNTSSKSGSTSPAPSPLVTGRSLFVGTQPALAASSSLQTLSRPGELADLRAKVSSLAAECERAVDEAARARLEVSEMRGCLQRSLGANLAISTDTRSADYSDELAACSSAPFSTANAQLAPNGEAPDAVSVIREQMQIFATALSSLDVRLKDAEQSLQRMAARPEMLLVSKERVQNLRQEEVEDSKKNGSELPLVQDSKFSPLSSIGQAEAGELVSIGLRQLREVGALADVLKLPSIIASSQGASAPAVLSAQVQDLRSEVARLAATQTRSLQPADDASDPKKNINILFDDVNKMKAHLGNIVGHLAAKEEHLDSSSIDQRFQSLRNELTGAIAELRAKNLPVALSSTPPPHSPSSDFAALREGLNNLKLKHSVPQAGSPPQER